MSSGSRSLRRRRLRRRCPVASRKPIRVHTAGHTKALYVERVGGGCGDIVGEDSLVVRMTGEAVWVISLSSLRAAIKTAQDRRRRGE